MILDVSLLVVNCVGWFCVMYAAFTGNWYVGWFIWVPFLTVLLAARVALKIINKGIA